MPSYQQDKTVVTKSLNAVVLNAVSYNETQNSAYVYNSDDVVGIMSVLQIPTRRYVINGDSHTAKTLADGLVKERSPTQWKDIRKVLTNGSRKLFQSSN